MRTSLLVGQVPITGREQVQQETRYSITSSARLDNVIGKVKSSVFAALRLIKNSTFVACSTGRSAGLAPFKIFPTTNLSATPRRPACPSRASSWSSLTTPWGFPCCVRFPCVHAVATTPAQRLLLRSFTPSRVSLPRKGCRVGLRIVLFERSLALRPAHSRCHQYVTRIPKASAISSPP